MKKQRSARLSSHIFQQGTDATHSTISAKFKSFFAAKKQQKKERIAEEGTNDEKRSRKKRRRKHKKVKKSGKRRVEETEESNKCVYAKSASQEERSKNLLDHPFATEFGDHFATSQEAINDVAPALRWMLKNVVSRKDGIIYDPYYCDGSIKLKLETLGFRRIVHENRNFYEDVKNGSVLEHDVLVTNPPYSSTHKSRILNFVLNKNRQRPWALLVPTYCVTKQWYKDAVKMRLSSSSQPFFIVPRTRYTYEHPTGKGHKTSPFQSVWIVCAWNRTQELFAWCKNTIRSARVAKSANELEHLHVEGVMLKRRPNPRARKKARKRRRVKSEVS